MIMKTIPVKIELEKTSFMNINIHCITDTTVTTADIQSVFGKGDGGIMQFVQQNKLQTLKFMTKYHTCQPPGTMDIAVEVNGLPRKPGAHIRSQIQAGGEVMIVHTWGTYYEAGHAYTAMENWLKKSNRKAKDAPFEVYLNDSGTVEDRSEIIADVYHPVE
jgi:effector-binding domain-containing protein